ncbi:FimV/HubP family polar landmark protein, partial [Piscinibacter sp.]|uniref:FimV/HubP family polar landmark protein n=1 Tax=Piscinibacter sp. TaxID=1903157 RepID=UPI002C442961
PAAPRAPAPAVVAQPAPAAVDEYRVRRGDTLYGIAGRTQREGASLEQMLVALFRDNPDAFIADNMNRLKAGAVLSVPSADTAQAVSNSEAREIIQAQSADFGAYRARLAAGVPAAKTEGSERQAGGKVEATVEDRKQAAAPTPDKLTLSKGGVSPKTPAPEDTVAKEREKQDAATRVAELSKNVEELRRLAAAASVPAATAPAPAPAPAAGTKPGVAITAPVVVPPAAPPAPPVEPASAVAAAPAPAASPVAAAPAASPVIAKRPASPPAARPAPPMEEPSVLEAMFDDNPWALGLGAALVALLAGFGIYRFSRRSKRDSGETSFLESRLQPDSFFGASGGQRIDTRDAGGASSSMSYSLSQLDAIGDVDPVAEADVYLAYGRDLQAEEILKEAMRSNPERMAIRTKLLEVYAKRRDTKGFELLATQLFALTRGEGEDWARAQELGQQIDPENTLYQPGGEPALPPAAEGARVSEPLGASTMPQSVLPSPSQFEAAHAELQARQSEVVDSGSVDLDLDLDLAGQVDPMSAPSPLVTTQPLQRQPEPSLQSDSSFSFDSVPDLPPMPPTPAPAASSEFPMDFDLSAISLDLESPGSASAPLATPSEENGADLSGIDFAAEDDDGADPLARKLELAEEFRQIGDMEGARDLLQEVVAKAGGALKTKAQGMLNDLS